MEKLVDLGTRATYADIAATVAEFLGFPSALGQRLSCGNCIDERIRGHE